MLGASVAGYRIEAVAGRGGMGVVYRARQVALDRAVALKLIAPELARDEAFRARFARESRIAASLDHPNVIPVYEAGEDGDRLFIAMRFVDGTDLGRMLASEGALEPALAAELVAQAASALDAAHARGLVHRDVKPANLLVAGEPPSRHVYLTDFGLARRDGSSTALTTTGQWMGTPDYAAPEQIDGYDLDARTDVYALGCVLFAALAGTPPFGDRPRMAKAAAHLHEPPPTLRSLRASVPPRSSRWWRGRWRSGRRTGTRARASWARRRWRPRRRRAPRRARGGCGSEAADAWLEAAAPAGRAPSPAPARLTGRAPRPAVPAGGSSPVVLVAVAAGGLAAALGAFSVRREEGRTEACGASGTPARASGGRSLGRHGPLLGDGVRSAWHARGAADRGLAVHAAGARRRVDQDRC